MRETSYRVKRWDTGEITYTGPLALAKRYARGAGHTGEDHPILTGYPPVAYVVNEADELVYNPRFRKGVGPAAAGLINSRESDCF